MRTSCRLGGDGTEGGACHVRSEASAPGPRLVPTGVPPSPAALSPAAEWTGVCQGNRVQLLPGEQVEKGSQFQIPFWKQLRGQRQKETGLAFPWESAAVLRLRSGAAGTDYLASMAGCLGLSREMATRSLETVHFQYQNGAWGQGLISHLMRGGDPILPRAAAAGTERSCVLSFRGRSGDSGQPQPSGPSQGTVRGDEAW